MNRDAILRDTFAAAVARVCGEQAVAAWLQRHPDIACDHLFACGKAAAAMTLGALQERDVERGLIITKHGHLDAALDDFPHLACLESDHPVPGTASLRAGRQLLEFLAQAPADASFLALISGGASSLVEVLAPGLDLDALGRLTECLLHEGLAIDEMNAVRRSVSCIKGGRLAHYLDGRTACALMISDVPGNDPGVIGSGPLTPMREDRLPEALSDTARGILERATGMPVPGPDAFRHLQTHIVATLEDAKEAAARHAAAQGLAAHLHPEFLDGDAAGVGRELAAWLQTPAAACGLHVWGGETTVRLPDRPGRGGRNQQLALAAACALAGASGIHLLACGTDGTDGPTDDAGGLVDGMTLARGQALQLDAEDFLARADAGAYLAATDALVTTGPTGTNVMDLALALKTEAA